MRKRAHARCVLGLVVSCCVAVGAGAQPPPGQIPPGPTPTPQALKHPAAPLQPVLNSSPPVDFGLTATITSPISVFLGWKTVPGAMGYTVLRDGAVLADLPVDARSYPDNTVTPQTQYRYQLRADGLSLMVNGRSTGFPLDSAAVQVEPPLALPPPGLTATLLQAVNRVQLTWTGRPEASAYQIVRAGQAFRVAASAQNSFIDTSPGSGDVLYTIATIVRTAAGTESLGYPGPPLSIRLRPCKVTSLPSRPL